MDIDHVGVPEKLALTLTISEKVTQQNFQVLTKRVRKGAGRIDGADSVVLSDGTVYQLEHCKDLSSINLKHGDIVERYLQDDDIVIFNRQPSFIECPCLDTVQKLWMVLRSDSTSFVLHRTMPTLMVTK